MTLSFPFLNSWLDLNKVLRSVRHVQVYYLNMLKFANLLNSPISRINSILQFWSTIRLSDVSLSDCPVKYYVMY